MSGYRVVAGANGISDPEILDSGSVAPPVHNSSAPSWLDTVMSPTVNVTQTIVTQGDDGETSEATGWLLDVRSDGMAGPAKRKSIDDVSESGQEVQSPKRQRISVPALQESHAASKGRYTSSPVSKHSDALINAKGKGTSTPLPCYRSLIDLIPEAIEFNPQAHIEDSKPSPGFETGRGWTSINDGTQSLLRPENDLAIEINTIIPAPSATASSSTNSPHSNTPSPTTTNSTSPPSSQPSKSVTRTTLPSRAAAKAKTPPAPTTSARRRRALPRNSTNTAPTAAGPSTSSASCSHIPAPSTLPTSTTPHRAATPSRPKWTGRPFRELTLEALRGAKATGYALDLAGIVAYIEAYRLTTDMQLPALNQTIRAAIHRLCVHNRPRSGLLEREVEEGRFTGRYVLVVRDGEEEGDDGDGDGDGEEGDDEEEDEDEQDVDDKQEQNEDVDNEQEQHEAQEVQLAPTRKRL